MNKFINRLNDMFMHVDAEPPLFTTIYEIDGKRGEVNYERTKMVGVKKPINQNFLIMLSVNMKHIIEHMNPSTEEEVTELRRGIMEHSKMMVENYESENGTT